MIGPWWAGSLFLFSGSKSMPGVGIVRSEVEVSDPRQAVSAVETRSWKSFVSPSQGYVGAGRRAGGVDEVADRDGRASPLDATRAWPPIVFWSRPTIRPKV